MFLLYCLLALLPIVYLYKASSKPKNFPPGPPRLPFLGSIPFLSDFEHDHSPLHVGKKMFGKYGKIYGAYLGPSKTMIKIADYDLAKAAMSTDELSGRIKDVPVSVVRPGAGQMNGSAITGIALNEGPMWTEQRRFALRTLRDRGFGKQSMEEGLNEEVNKLCDLLAAKKDQPIDLLLQFNISVLNALWQMMMGDKMELNDPHLLNVMDRLNQMMKTSGFNPVLSFFLPSPKMLQWPILRKFFQLDAIQKGTDGIADLVRKAIADHKQALDAQGDDEEDRDLLDTYLKESRKAAPSSHMHGVLGHHNTLNSFIDFFIAGSETTSTSLVWTMLYLIHHPDIQTRLQAEIDAVVGHDRSVSLDDEKDLPLTRAVIQESFRCASLPYDSVPHNVTKDVTVGGYFFPKDAVVFTSVSEIHYDPERYAAPEVFNPDRYLDADGAFVKDDHVIPFGVGKRYCLGQSLGEKEAFLFTAGLMQRMTVRNFPGMPLPGYGMDETRPHGPVRMPPPFKVKMVERI